MKKKLGVVLMFVSWLSQAVEMNLDARNGMSGELRDGVRMATGRILCREAHSEFHIWMNTQQVENRPGRYIVEGKYNTRHKIRVRLEGDGWLSSAINASRDVIKVGSAEQAAFDVVADGNQSVAPDEYIFTVSGECL
ncbi:TPA: AfaD family invasin [Salmonella enterica subsp. enterica serovar Typhimurium]|uniref:AfaD family invasin n=1 Tax=Escherichia coli TaxID=562 RepID=UPI000F0AA1B3|nr:AfaD family invasin [Escherichia coli]HBA3709468.1 adhesin [Escherichia coli]